MNARRRATVTRWNRLHTYKFCSSSRLTHKAHATRATADRTGAQGTPYKFCERGSRQPRGNTSTSAGRRNAERHRPRRVAIVVRLDEPI